jgi:circadian clock protein KaiB
MAQKEKGNEPPQPRNITKEFEQALEKTDETIYVLRLYVSGLTPNSQRAIENIRKICEEYLQGRYDLEIIDIFQQPALATEGQVIAAPTLIKELPLPLRKFIGDMSRTERLIVGLDLKKKKKE